MIIRTNIVNLFSIHMKDIIDKYDTMAIYNSKIHDHVEYATICLSNKTTEKIVYGLLSCLNTKIENKPYLTRRSFFNINEYKLHDGSIISFKKEDLDKIASLELLKI